MRYQPIKNGGEKDALPEWQKQIVHQLQTGLGRHKHS